MLIAEDLLLLIYDDETGKPMVGNPGLDYALAGAVLIELTMLGKVDSAGAGEAVKKDRLIVRDETPTGDLLLDKRLALLVGREGAKPKNVIDKVSKKLRPELLERLNAKGVLTADKGKVLGLFPVTRWPAQDASHELEVRASLESALKLGMQPDDRTAALIALLHALNVVPKVVTDAVDKKALKRRAKEIAESAWAAEAVRQAVAAVQAALTAAIVASTAAGASGGS
ncbi:GOLPH3/VPS74 family protein [Kribbella deserti]|uniref:GPP34 family phosphoprotein n=1 Tax=Kribbella deserti TaxID=1926257 RepID=A0ABV6QZP0_9ACTN